MNGTSKVQLNPSFSSSSKYPMVRGKDWNRRQTNWLREWKARARIRTPRYSSIENPICVGPDRTMLPAPYLTRIWEIISKVREKDPSADSLILSAFRLAWEGHAGQIRKDGITPYIVHPLSVAKIVADWGLGEEGVSAALCHDLIEQGKINGKKVTKEFLEEKLNTRAAQLVDGITELGKELEFKGEEPPLVDIIKKYLEYGAEDLASIIDKLADRLHNMRTLAYVKEDVAKEKAKETLNAYARIADRLGMWELKRELEDLSFKYLKPEIYQEIETRRKEIIKTSKRKIKDVVQELHEHLAQSRLRIEIIVEKRFIYELSERMRKRKISIEDLSPSDIWRINIVVPEKQDCRDIEGWIHEEIYSPVQGEIRHYIGRNALPNGHEFLHSYVQVRDFGRLLIQIRDREMQKNYLYGVLSKIQENKRWYKESFTWLNALIKDLKSEGVKEDALYEMIAAKTDPIVVFNRWEEPAEVKFGETALDYAHKINDPEIFLHAKEAIIDRKGERRTAPLSEVLQPGDTVFIVTDPDARPTLEWMDWLRTTEALEYLRTYLEDQPVQPLFEPARRLLNEKSMKYYLPGEALLQDEFFKSFIIEEGIGDEIDFFTKLARGGVRIEELLSRFMEKYYSAVKGSRAEERLSGFRIIGEDRPGLLDDITNKLRTQKINLAAGDFYKYSEEDGKETGEIELIIEGVSSLARGIQQLQIKTIIGNTKGVKQFTALTNEEIEELQGIITKRKKRRKGKI